MVQPRTSSQFCSSIVPSAVQDLNVRPDVVLRSVARRHRGKQNGRCSRVSLICYAHSKVSLVASSPETAFPANATCVVAIGDAFVGKERERQSSRYRNCRIKHQVVHFGIESEAKRTLGSVRWPLNCVIVKWVHHGHLQWIEKLGVEQEKSSLLAA